MNIDEGERRARLRSMRALVLTFCGPAHPLGAALRAAEAGDAETLADALAEIDRLPALTRRRLLSTFALLSRKS
jgi:hypothetical protein